MQPNPLFKKLDEAQLKAFKEQFAGEQGVQDEKTKQKSKKKTTSTHTVDISPKSAAEVAELESQVSKQVTRLSCISSNIFIFFNSGRTCQKIKE